MNTKRPAQDWTQLYLATLQNLRRTWPHSWPGLPVVLEACMHRLWSGHAPKVASPTGQLLQAAQAMARHMENLAQQTDAEPQYHNRLHTADALTAVCLLMQALQDKGHALSDEWIAAILLAVTSHDVLHPGGANSFLQEFEQRSALEMRRVSQKWLVEHLWLDRVSEMILRTDPSLVAGNHDKVKGLAFEMNLDWACVLINEADILASATASHGTELGQALAAEWAEKNHPLSSVVGTAQGRLQFLASLRFSTPASEVFQMRMQVSQQMTLLQ
jgi:hypothetical protein